MKKIFVYNRPAFRPFLWCSIAVGLGCLLLLPPYYFVRTRILNSERIWEEFSFEFFGAAALEFFIFWFALFLLWSGLRRLTKIERIFVDPEFISFAGGLFLSSGKRFYTGGWIKIPLSKDFRFRAVKDGFLKGVGFYLDFPVDGGRHSYLIAEHCGNPFRLAGRINAVLEECGSFARTVHMSKPLEKRFHKKKGKKETANAVRKKAASSKNRV
ncbi:hypothetical protein CH375_21275 [Leptospira ellisii]|nr:hypothetical protein CH379_17235 [Leptospira ellisii]PKA02724.1 hypothetical protein CH375_21275 [Leptospira ellisii]